MLAQGLFTEEDVQVDDDDDDDYEDEDDDEDDQDAEGQVGKNPTRHLHSCLGKKKRFFNLNLVRFFLYSLAM